MCEMPKYSLEYGPHFDNEVMSCVGMAASTVARNSDKNIGIYSTITGISSRISAEEEPIRMRYLPGSTFQAFEETS